MPNFSTVFSDPNVMLGAWKRTEAWYRGGEGVPEPDFTAWQLNRDARLKRLSENLARGTYSPSAMPLVPYPKSGIKIRHYCQPEITDQVAFMAFAVLLAPVFESVMKPVSFGNRWYRGVVRADDENSNRWTFRRFSFDDAAAYQPYSRAHGLFRRVASWTVDGMLKHRRGWQQGTRDSLVIPEELPEGMLPEFADRKYWDKHKAVKRACWARFDLKLAFPSIRMDLLRSRMEALLDEVFPYSNPKSTKGISFDFPPIKLDESLALYGDGIRHALIERKFVGGLCDFLMNSLEAITYDDYPLSSSHCFGGDDSAGNPPILPEGTGNHHPGLPTGLGISPLLLNVFLHPIDAAMSQWFLKNHGGAYYRFADDIVLLADSTSRLAQSIEVLTEQIFGSGGDDTNLRINWRKVKPLPLRNEFKRLGLFGTAKPLKNFSKNGKVLRSIGAAAVTKSQNPFITDLVECLSELGTDREVDCLPENATSRVARLRELVFFEPNDEAVPKATLLVFAANQLSRTWLPEQKDEQDAETIESIRDAVGKAVEGASDKPRLWRSILRAAVRRPFSEKRVPNADKQASAWLEAIAARYSLRSTGDWLLTEDQKIEGEKVDAERWRLFTTYHRAAMWRALSEVSKEISSGLWNLDSKKEFANPESWLFRAFDEKSLKSSSRWLEQEALRLSKILYGSDHNADHDGLSEWESSSFAAAMLSFVPRDAVAHYFLTSRQRTRHFYPTIAKLLKAKGSRWETPARLLESVVMNNPPRATSARILALSKKVAGDEEEVGWSITKRVLNFGQLLRVADFLGVQATLQDRREQIYKEFISAHAERMDARKGLSPWRIFQELARYHQARRIWIGLSK